MKLIFELSSLLILSQVIAEDGVESSSLLSPCNLRCNDKHLSRTYAVKRFESGVCIESCVRFPLISMARGSSCGRCPKEFEDLAELQTAVDTYLADNSASSEIARIYGHPIGMWQVHKVQSFAYLFDGARNTKASTFNENISGWNVRSANDMKYMFASNGAFNQDIGKWDVSRVTTMEGMFEEATSFNGAIGLWNVARVQDMSYMFEEAGAFAKDLSSWDVRSVRDMSHMFSSAQLFNSPLGSWNVSSVTNFAYMFAAAQAFSQNLCPWGDRMTSLTAPKVLDMFFSTKCPLKDDPSVSENLISPLCFDCINAGGR